MVVIVVVGISTGTNISSSMNRKSFKNNVINIFIH